MLAFGPVVDEQQQPGSGQAIDKRVEHGLAFGVDPVQVFEHEHKGCTRLSRSSSRFTAS